MAQFTLGSISTGTLRPEDLLSVFGKTAESLGFDPTTNNQSRSLVETIAYLIDILNDFCPPFVYFGAHPGDAADFGFWPDWDQLNEVIRWQGRSFGPGMQETTLQEEGAIVQVSDHDNVTVMDLDRNIIWSTV